MELPLSRAGVGPRGPESVRLTPVREVSNARAAEGISRLRIYHLLEYGILSMNPLLVYYVSCNCLKKKIWLLSPRKSQLKMILRFIYRQGLQKYVHLYVGHFVKDETPRRTDSRRAVKRTCISTRK